MIISNTHSFYFYYYPLFLISIGSSSLQFLSHNQSFSLRSDGKETSLETEQVDWETSITDFIERRSLGPRVKENFGRRGTCQIKELESLYLGLAKLGKRSKGAK